MENKIDLKKLIERVQEYYNFDDYEIIDDSNFRIFDVTFSKNQYCWYKKKNGLYQITYVTKDSEELLEKAVLAVVKKHFERKPSEEEKKYVKYQCKELDEYIASVNEETYGHGLKYSSTNYKSTVTCDNYDVDVKYDLD